MQHYPGHLIMGVAALAATLLIVGSTLNTLVQRKLKLSVVLFAGYTLFNLIVFLRPGLIPGVEEDVRSVERLVFAAAFINLLVHVLINPLRANRVPDAFPSIVQDAIVIALLVLIATFVFQDKLLTTSAVGAVVVGFALQDTLGNAFAGLGIQSEKPFRVGHWIRVGDFEGRVAEVTWRATKLRTKAGNFVVVPNNIIAKEAITNYSEPAIPTRLELDVGASYLSTPADVKAAMLEAMRQVPRVLATPAPDALLHSFDGSAITYRARFWVAEYSSTRRRATRSGRRSSTPSAAAGSRSRGRSRSATSARGRSRTPPPSSATASRCSPTSTCSRASPTSSGGRWRRRQPFTCTATAK